MPLSGLNKVVPPLAEPFQIFKEDHKSSRVEANLSGLLKPCTEVEALVDTARESCVLWLNGQNVLEAAGYLVRVEVSHRYIILRFNFLTLSPHN